MPFILHIRITNKKIHPVQDPVQHPKHILSKLFLTWGTAPWRLSSCRLQELLGARTPGLWSAVCQLFLSSSAGHYKKDVNVNSVGDAWYFWVDPDPGPGGTRTLIRIRNTDSRFKNLLYIQSILLILCISSVTYKTKWKKNHLIQYCRTSYLIKPAFGSALI